jgi:hypothetical protein
MHRAMVSRVKRVAFFLALAVLLGGCGGEEPATDAKAALADVKPISSANLDALLRIRFDNAPPEVGDELTLRFRGPLRANGPGKLPSLDWRIDFTGLDTSFSSRVVSTGNNLFIRLGGADFEVGEDAIAQLNRQSSQAAGGRDGLSAIGIDPLAAIKDVREDGDSTVGGAPTTRYVGRVDLNRVLDQVERFLRTVPRQPAAGQSIPRLNLTPEQRTQVVNTFGEPSFEAHVAEDDTLRRLVVSTRFSTPEANRDAAGGITGGLIDYRLEYSDVGADVAIEPVRGARPIEEFSAALQRELAK